MDVYPAWSPDGAYVAFHSWRDKDLDLYTMTADGGNVRKLYDSGSNDADIDWVDETAIWKMNDNGTLPSK